LRTIQAVGRTPRPDFFGGRETASHGLFVTIDLHGELLAKVRNLPFDRLRVNGLRLKVFSFSVRGELVEPQKILLQEPLVKVEF